MTPKLYCTLRPKPKQLTAIDGIYSESLPKFYGDTEERRQFGVDDVVFRVLREASWARLLAAAAEGRVRKWLLETINGMKWEEWNLSANDRYHVAERRKDVRSLFTHGARQGGDRRQFALGRLDSIADLLLEPQAEANVHSTIPTRLKSMFEPLEAAAAASLGPGPHFKLDGVGAVGVLEDNNAIFANLVLQFCIKDLPVDFDERHAAVREVYALRDKHLRATCPSLLDGFIKKVHGDDVDTKGMEFLRSVYELAPLVGEEDPAALPFGPGLLPREDEEAAADDECDAGSDRHAEVTRFLAGKGSLPSPQPGLLIAKPAHSDRLAKAG